MVQKCGCENEVATVPAKYITVHVDVPDTGAVKASFRKSLKNAVVYLIPSDTAKSEMAKVKDSWEKGLPI